MVVIFSMLLHWGHLYVHFFTDTNFFEIKKEVTLSKTTLQSTETSKDVCHACDFYFGDFIDNSNIPFLFKKSIETSYFTSFYKQNDFSYFKGSFFSLRAPPLF